MVNPQVKENISDYQIQHFVLKYGELSCDVADKVVSLIHTEAGVPWIVLYTIADDGTITYTEDGQDYYNQIVDALATVVVPGQE
tara:strand:- start:561 stop:812 length:252 start_codon:yes stop_codon:yes gene_type:complete